MAPLAPEARIRAAKPPLGSDATVAPFKPTWPRASPELEYRWRLCPSNPLSSSAKPDGSLKTLRKLWSLALKIFLKTAWPFSIWNTDQAMAPCEASVLHRRAKFPAPSSLVPVRQSPLQVRFGTTGGGSEAGMSPAHRSGGGGGGREKAAVTLASACRVRSQAPEPLQSPCHPSNFQPVSAMATR